MKVVYFTDGSRPYSGFTASYTSSDDAGNSHCCEYTCVTVDMASDLQLLPAAAESSVFPSEIKVTPRIFQQKTQAKSPETKDKNFQFWKENCYCELEKLKKKMLLEELLAEFHAMSPLQTTASPTALGQFSVLKKARNLLEGSLLPEGN